MRAKQYHEFNHKASGYSMYQRPAQKTISSINLTATDSGGYAFKKKKRESPNNSKKNAQRKAGMYSTQSSPCQLIKKYTATSHNMPHKNDRGTTQ